MFHGLAQSASQVPAAPPRRLWVFPAWLRAPIGQPRRCEGRPAIERGEWASAGSEGRRPPGVGRPAAAGRILPGRERLRLRVLRGWRLLRDHLRRSLRRLRSDGERRPLPAAPGRRATASRPRDLRDQPRDELRSRRHLRREGRLPEVAARHDLHGRELRRREQPLHAGGELRRRRDLRQQRAARLHALPLRRNRLPHVLRQRHPLHAGRVLRRQ